MSTIRDDGYSRTLGFTGAATPGAADPPLGPEPSPEPAAEPQPQAQALDDRVAAMTVDAVTDAIKAGEIDQQEAVEAERRGRQRVGILSLGDAEDE